MSEQAERFFELLLGMTEKELRTRYKYTFLGFLWILVVPLFQMFVIGSIFAFFVKEPIDHYYYFLYVGLLIWNFFSISLTKTTGCVVQERYLIGKASFPRIIIPLSIILSNIVHLVFGLLLAFIPLLFINMLGGWRWLLVIPALGWLAVFTIGLSLLTSSLNVRYRDVNLFVQVILMLWFYATPIVYPLSFIPERYHWIWMLNPLTAPTQLFQYALLNMSVPTLTVTAANAVVTVITLVCGTYIFLKESDYFDDWV